jgi:nucleotide-binding universal stress UspA family protein
LARNHDLVAERLPSHAEQAYSCALELAKVFSSKIVFVYALQVSAQTRRLIESEFQSQNTVIDKARMRLNRLVKRAENEGVKAESRVFCGRSWEKLIRQVPRGKHDLVVIGARQLSLLQRLFNRSTGLQLLRSCPCPVWLARPNSPKKMESILIAVDETEAGQWALDAGVSLAEFYRSELHILHSFGGATNDQSYRPMQPGEISRVIANRVTAANLTGEVKIQKTTESPCQAIQDYMDRRPVDLLTIGSYPCDSKMMLTAEKLYPRLSCSLLALNSTPVDFITPVKSSFHHETSFTG